MSNYNLPRKLLLNFLDKQKIDEFREEKAIVTLPKKS